MSNALSRLRRGATSILSGLAQVSKDREVRKAYRFILVALFLLTLALNAAGLYSVWLFTAPETDMSTWREWGLVVLRLAGSLLVLLLSPLLAITTCNLLFPVFSEIPFLAGMKSFDEARSARLAARPGLGNAAAIVNSLRRFGIFVLVSFGCFLLGLVPVVGPLLAPPLQFYFAAKTVGFELMDPYFDRVGLVFSEQKSVVQAKGPEIFGLGLVCAPILAIPLVGPLFFGLIQAGAAKFVVDHFPESDTRDGLLGSGA